LDPAVVQEAVRAMDELAVAFRWQKGDVILIDNHTVMHARKPITGKRVITASLATHTWR
jgi:alpha-ketoglutarate-dependent taurine dioxygenase